MVLPSIRNQGKVLKLAPHHTRVPLLSIQGRNVILFSLIAVISKMIRLHNLVPVIWLVSLYSYWPDMPSRDRWCAFSAKMHRV